jgi:hypothetical protein
LPDDLYAALHELRATGPVRAVHLVSPDLLSGATCLCRDDELLHAHRDADERLLDMRRAPRRRRLLDLRRSVAFRRLCNLSERSSARRVLRAVDDFPGRNDDVLRTVGRRADDGYSGSRGARSDDDQLPVQLSDGGRFQRRLSVSAGRSGSGVELRPADIDGADVDDADVLGPDVHESEHVCCSSRTGDARVHDELCSRPDHTTSPDDHERPHHSRSRRKNDDHFAFGRDEHLELRTDACSGRRADRDSVGHEHAEEE